MAACPKRLASGLACLLLLSLVALLPGPAQAQGAQGAQGGQGGQGGADFGVDSRPGRSLGDEDKEEDPKNWEKIRTRIKEINAYCEKRKKNFRINFTEGKTIAASSIVLQRVATDGKHAKPRIIQSEKSYMDGRYLRQFLRGAEPEKLPNFDVLKDAMRVMDVLGATKGDDFEVEALFEGDHAEFTVRFERDERYVTPFRYRYIVLWDKQKMVMEEPAKFWMSKTTLPEHRVDELVKAIRGPMAPKPPPTEVALDEKIKKNSPDPTPSPTPASSPASPPASSPPAFSPPASAPGSKEGWSTGSKVMAGILAGGLGVGGAVALKFIVGAALRKTRPPPMGNMQNMKVASDAIYEDGHGALDQGNVTFKSNRIPQ
eukprot:GHVT01040899.1.p1 GENE.GHVT01040899.1~~GHVT01040899.1.p1  ORF type:complete len:373 (+),score=69.63 GHVT01040899.1:89-1207(+)